MCQDCWREFGSPADQSAEIIEAAELIRKLYEAEPTGGPLHAALDDWNIEGPIRTDGGYSAQDPPASVVEAVESLADLLNRMPVRARASALAHARGLTGAPS